jgi:hypothetical protein
MKETMITQFFAYFGSTEVFRYAQGNTLHSEIKRKTCFPFVFLSTFRNFAS